jgi:hypothetical protein
MIKWFKQQYKAWKDRRFLKRHGCRDWEEYHYCYDPDRNIRCTRVKDYYHGYPYWHVFERSNHYCYKLLYDYGPGGHRCGYHDIIDWCEENAKGKHRTDFLRVIKYPSTGNEWEINEFVGGDHIFVAFKEERDYLMFVLRWS